MRKRIHITIVLLFALSIGIALAGCPGKKVIGIEEMQTHYDDVKECMGVNVPVTPPKLNIVPGDKVTCSGAKRRGCYNSATMTITLPTNSDETTIRHEYVHHLLYVTTGDSDNLHESDYFLRCSGVIIEGDA